MQEQSEPELQAQEEEQQPKKQVNGGDGIDQDDAGVEPAEPPSAEEHAALQEELLQAVAERDKYHRAAADHQNARKRAEQERDAANKYGVTRLARDLLPTYDNLKAALANIREADSGVPEKLTEGIELTQRELLRTLNAHSVTIISPQCGDPFDPNLHDASFYAASQDMEAGRILQVMADGFKIHERLLRPAIVGVSSGTVTDVEVETDAE
ncbi:MAG: nucleotide exchange factor GrpE [Rhodobacteraceae bacterium]|nr:nucleotide exchange factor GrpE [Paracoccaceae bacterium]